MLRKLISLSLLLTTIPAVLGMEVECHRERKRKAEEILETKLPTKPIILISKEGDQYEVIPEIVEFSEAIKGFYGDFDSETKQEAIQIPIPATGETIALLVKLVKDIQQAIESQANDKELSIDCLIKAPNGHIIARNLQRVVDKKLVETRASLHQLVWLMDFLCMPELSNAVAPMYLRTFQKDHFNIMPNATHFQIWLQLWGFSKSINELLIKHWYLQQAGITREWSIKDLISVGNELKIDRNKRLDLGCKDLTSLDGLYDLKEISKLTFLSLENNKLTALPSDTFHKLTNLENLYLSNNQLVLSEDLFQGLTFLRVFDLENNQLTTLPENLFDGLTSLCTAYLRYNQFTEQEKEKIKDNIKKVAPNCRVLI